MILVVRRQPGTLINCESGRHEDIERVPEYLGRFLPDIHAPGLEHEDKVPAFFEEYAVLERNRCLVGLGGVRVKEIHGFNQGRILLRA